MAENLCGGDCPPPLGASLLIVNAMIFVIKLLDEPFEPKDTIYQPVFRDNPTTYNHTTNLFSNVNLYHLDFIFTRGSIL